MTKNLSSLKTSLLGFTLVELLVSVAIIVILSAVGIAGFNSASQNSAVKSQAQEIKTLIRKMRTDAGAALKPITNVDPNLSCKSNDPTIPDKGTVYGSYIYFDDNTSSVTYGTSCFDKTDPLISYSSSNTFQLKTGLIQGSTSDDNLTVFFGFDGEVKFLSITNPPPTKAEIDAASSFGNSISIRVTNGTDIYSGVMRQVSINRNGLICDEAVGAVVCAE